VRPAPGSRFDVAIVGGGPAGATTAIALLERGRSVLVIERSRYDAPRVGETLPPRARLLLVQLGVWERFNRARHLPSPGTLAAWGGANLTANDFAFNPYGAGWHLDRARFDEMLARRVSELGGRVLRGTRMTRCERETAMGWRVESDAGVHRARFLVDATGRTASIARQLAVRRVEYDRLVGIAAFAPALGQDTRTLVEAARDGWWYAALLPNSQVIVAFMTDADLKPNRGVGFEDSRHSGLRAYWDQELAATRYTRARVGDGASISSLHTLAANSFRLTRAAGKGWLAVGDAARAIDPLSSRGLYDALESGLRAGAAIDRRLNGDGRGMKEYAARAESQFARHLELRTSYYSQEERWSEAPFWKRRRANRDLPMHQDSLNQRDTNTEESDHVS
jgi:flavin-dependent dehydrogenase